MKVLAPAKINLGLYITDKRPDGYHELASLFLPVGLFDNLDIQSSGSTGELEISTSGPFAFCGDAKNNTVYKAYQAIKQVTGINAGFKVYIEKNIPSQAGLGGGSADAGAFINAVNKVLDLKLKPLELESIASKIGADVPFFISQTPAFVEGIGEKLTPFELLRDYWVVIAKPLAGLDTAMVYANLTLSLTLKNINAKRKEHLRSIAFQGLKEAGELVGLSNDLEVPSVKLLPEILEIKRFLEGQKPISCMMSGSGSAVFAIFDKDISKIKEAENKNWFFCKTKVLRGSV